MKPQIICSIFLTLLAVVVSGESSAESGLSNLPLVVFAVRHAEKKTGDDPALTSRGTDRARILASMLRNANIEHIHTTDYIRTRETAAPTAAALKVEVSTYNPRDLDSLVEKLRSGGGRHLVVGHSNTTPRLVELLGGDPGSPIDEHHEFDRLFIITIGADDSITSVLLRYGN